ncbi:MAG TPA: FecR domain-containing protein [Pyrinomonadaceae bacterium]|nr:FecR domain-containing protein [Pyrinomonadaceae bacterium]
MRNESARVNLEWVVVSKRRVYAAALLLLAALGAGAYLWLNGSPSSPALADSPPVEGARFQILEGEVRVVRSGTREVVKADAGTRLFPGDVVQTQATGHASLKLADGSTLSIQPNSVIAIAENAGSGAGTAAHVRVAVEGGQVKVNTEAQPPGVSNVVETPLAKNSLSARTAATFDVHEDRSEEVRVGSGAVERSTGEGRTAIGAGEYVAFGGSGEVRRRERLLDAPVAYAPAHLERIPAQADGEAAVTLRWTRPMASVPAFYQVELASSPFFVKQGIVFERGRLSAPELIITGLRQGNYFWRVRAVSNAGQDSEWCTPQKFTVFHDEGTVR